MQEVLLFVGGRYLNRRTARRRPQPFRKSQLFGMAPNDPIALISATLTLAVVACLAGFLPALAASRVHPTQALPATNKAPAAHFAHSNCSCVPVQTPSRAATARERLFCPTSATLPQTCKP